MRVLVVDDDRSIRRSIEKFLGDLGYAVSTAEDGPSGLAAIERGDADVVLLDLGLPGIDGLEVLARTQGRDATPPIIVISARDDMRTTITAMQRGAWDYVVKPLDIERLRISVQRALESRELSRRIDGLVETMARDYQVDNLVGRTPAMREVFKTIGMVSTSRATVLITGESGTGKELIARALHENSSRKDSAFIRVNCGAIPRDLMEAELFGHERGAFTGAVSSKPGRFELAHGGTLFLDEIAEIPVEMQVKLLRAIQEGEIDRVGGIKPITVDVRLVAASNRELKREIAAGRFREDLFYRLNVVPIHLPPLRERRTDIPLLVEHFLKIHAQRFRKPVTQLSPDAREALVNYGWPGNIRELENVIERCVLLSDGDTIRLRDLAPEVRAAAPGAGGSIVPDEEDDESGSNAPGGLKEQVREATTRLEREMIVRALAQTGHNVTQTARLLKISRKSLQIKMKELGLREQNG